MLYINSINNTKGNITHYTTTRKPESLATADLTTLMRRTRKMQRPNGNWTVCHFILLLYKHLTSSNTLFHPYC